MTTEINPSSAALSISEIDTESALQADSFDVRPEDRRTQSEHGGKKESETKINPFGDSDIKDYDKLFSEFGVSKFESLAKKLPKPLAIMRRGIVFAHRDFDKIIKCIKEKKPFAVMSGIKPTNYLHLGNKMVIDEMVYLQKLGAKAYYCIADVEAVADNKLDFEETNKIAYDNMLDAIALGIDPKRGKIYKQSDELNLYKYSYLFSRNVTNNMAEAIYGERHFSLYMVTLIEASDHFLPQIENGKMPTIIPVGFDQDPHIRLTRDLAEKYGFERPSSIYHKFIASLTGEAKMSKRKPEGMIYLREDPDSARKKIMNALTGGGNTIEEHRKYGGKPDICKVYELFLFGFEDNDAALKKRYASCKAGKLTCGQCKRECADRVCKFLEAHQKRRKAAEKIVAKL